MGLPLAPTIRSVLLMVLVNPSLAPMRMRSTESNKLTLSAMEKMVSPAVNLRFKIDFNIRWNITTALLPD